MRVDEQLQIAKAQLDGVSSRYGFALGGDLALYVHGLIDRAPEENIRLYQPQGAEDSSNQIVDYAKISVIYDRREMEFRPVQKDGIPVMAIEDCVLGKLARIAERRARAQDFVDVANMVNQPHANGSRQEPIFGPERIDALLATSARTVDPHSLKMELLNIGYGRKHEDAFTKLGLGYTEQTRLRINVTRLGEGLDLASATWIAAEKRLAFGKAKVEADKAQHALQELRRNPPTPSRSKALTQRLWHSGRRPPEEERALQTSIEAQRRETEAVSAEDRVRAKAASAAPLPLPTAERQPVEPNDVRRQALASVAAIARDFGSPPGYEQGPVHAHGVEQGRSSAYGDDSASAALNDPRIMAHVAGARSPRPRQSATLPAVTPRAIRRMTSPTGAGNGPDRLPRARRR